MKSDAIRGTSTLATAAVMAAVLCWPGGANAQPDCDAERCSIQAAIDAQCPCEAATNHGDYVRCVREQVNALASRQCRGKIVRCQQCGMKVRVPDPKPEPAKTGPATTTAPNP